MWCVCVCVVCGVSVCVCLCVVGVCYWVCAAVVGSAELAELEAEESQARPAGAAVLGSAEEAAPAARSGGGGLPRLLGT